MIISSQVTARVGIATVVIVVVVAVVLTTQAQFQLVFDHLNLLLCILINTMTSTYYDIIIMCSHNSYLEMLDDVVRIMS